jgi:hypothetical protein
MATTSSPQRSRSKKNPTDRAARSRAKANGKPADAGAGTEERTTDVAQGTAGTLHQVIDKAKGPALGGAALAAIAGGVALARHSRRSSGLSLPGMGRKHRGIHMPNVSMPHLSLPHLPQRSGGDTTKTLGATTKALGAAAVEVGKAGYRVGELAAEVRRMREQAARKGD